MYCQFARNIKIMLIDEEIRERATQVIHKGFEGIEYEAIQKYFSYYKLDLSSMPTLHPEFRNPLFLKTVCKELSKKGAKRLPRGIQGTSKIFNLYLYDVNKRLSSKLKCNPSRNYVWDALRKFAQRMIDDNKRWLDVETAEETVNELLPGRTYEDSLYNGLLSEDLLIEDLSIEENNIVYISYERLADHIIAKFLLDEHFNPNEPEAAFAENGGLAFLLDKKRRHQLEQLIEAFSIQIPERTNKESQGSKELLEIVPSLIEYWGASEAFRQSIIWREPNAVSDATLDVLNKSIEVQGSDEDIWDMFLTVATVPEHPYNAYFLHDELSRFTMAERDALWSIYLYRPWDSQSPAYRLVDWVLKLLPDTKLEEDVVELASIALAWILTTSNRFLRDRATKALVTLLTKHLDILLVILQRFADVNDPYVAERLYAVAYGVVMRRHDVKDVAQWVYDNVFANGEPPADILLRDYARGVVERALYLGLDIKVDEQLIKPPYKSAFPHIPTEEEITELMADWKDASYDGKGRVEWARYQIKWSVMDDDFAWYVIGTNSSRFSRDWLSIRLNEEIWIPWETKMEELISQAGENVQMAWEICENAYTNKKQAEFRCELSTNVQPNAEDELKKAIRDFKDKLNEEQLAQVDMILNYWEPGKYETPPGFELIHIQRYILTRVFDLGWTIERFWEFDRLKIGYQGRGASKAERIGKKYQWIAYHEIIAYISDHFQYLIEDGKVGRYDGPWQDDFRDIDPSVTLSFNQGGTHWKGHKPSWWADEPYRVWKENETHCVWVKREDDIPEIEKLMSPNDSKNVSWLNLRGNFIWRQSDPTKTESVDADVDSRELWLSFTGCFVRNRDVKPFMNWVKKVNSQKERHITTMLERYG